MMSNLISQSQKGASAKERKGYTVSELEELAADSGAELVFNSSKSYFTLHNPENGTWVWIVHPETEKIIKTVRELSRQEWPLVMVFNLQRLKKEAKK